MQFYTIVAPTYDDALREARTKYGAAVRMQSRRDYVEKHLFGKKHFCEVCFYLVDTKESEPDR